GSRTRKRRTAFISRATAARVGTLIGSTAKHHVSNIYRKIGVFDRQGLLDTIEQGGVGKSTWE
ncbi:MAG: hypothetical protein RR842_14515, partial [Gordonibacter sp.]|uniref:hypothetical protein n=1 Tax=Gordonibacter sp. TaxID=1968902 RepID=UPI002FCBF43E